MKNKFGIHTFVAGTPEQTARKVCEEAMEFYAEHAALQATPTEDDYGYMLHMSKVEEEIGDVFTALSNYCSMCGIDIQRCIDLVEAKNIMRGRYDK